MPGIIKQMFIVLVLLLLVFGGSLSTKRVSMNNKPCLVRPTIIDLNADEIDYYPCIVSLDRCYGIRNTVEDLFGTVWVLNKIEDINLKIFTMIKGISELKTLINKAYFM